MMRPEGRSKIKITFPQTGHYSFEKMEVICQPMDNYARYVDDLRNESFEQVKFGNDMFSGVITVDRPKILCMAVPYSAGWKAYVDGIETDVMRANVWSMAIELEAGEHFIEFRYFTPGLKAGMLISCMGLLAMVAIEIGRRKKKWFI
ncbi:MAG: YfhO family protein [Clostridia bacterium]|nr:YfhO family protein [Clostridia bacterium]